MTAETADVAPRADDERLCGWPGCKKEARSKGLCPMHYQRQREGRDMDAPAGARSGEPRVARSPGRRRGTLAEIKRGLAFGLTIINLMLFKASILDAEDALNPQEVDLLADGLAHEIEGNKRAAEWFGRLDKVNAHLPLIKACYLIALPRLVRHGVIPDVGNPFSVEAGGTSSNHRGYGDGKIDADVAPFGAQSVHANGVDESRPGFTLAGQEAY